MNSYDLTSTVLFAIAITVITIGVVLLTYQTRQQDKEMAAYHKKRMHMSNIDLYCEVNGITSQSDKYLIIQNNCPIVRRECYKHGDNINCEECRKWWLERRNTSCI